MKCRSPLIVACMRGEYDAVINLLDKGANVDAIDSIGRSALMWASIYCHPDIVKELLKRGADTEIRDSESNTAADWADIFGCHIIVQMMKNYDAPQQRAKKRMEIIKEELIEVVFHPDRVQKWVDYYGLDWVDYI